MKTINVRTSGMHCPSCSMIIEMNVGDLPGVEEVKVSLADGMTVVSYDPSALDEDTITEEIRKAGYKAEVL